MRNTFYMLLLLGLQFTLTGCSICPPGYLDDYATVGGKWQRSNPSHGRVGSILSDAGATIGSPVSATAETYYESSSSSGYPYESTFIDPNYNGQTYYEGTGSAEEYYQPTSSMAMQDAVDEQYSTAPGYDPRVMDGGYSEGSSDYRQGSPSAFPAGQSSAERSILERP